MCIPESKEQAIEILKLARERGLLDDTGYNRAVLDKRKDWPMSDKDHYRAVSFSRYVFAFGDHSDIVIPVSEFIARLKGEWEPAKEATAPETITLSFNGKEYTYKHVIL